MIKSFLSKFIQVLADSYLIFLGFFLFAFYFWIRFIRVRLPQDIPFNLSVLKFLILLFICFIYLYVIYRIYKKPQLHPIFLSLIPYILWIFKSLAEFDHYLKALPYIKEKFHTLVIYLAHKLDYSDPSRLEHLLFIGVNNIPRMILLFVFFLDVFYFHKLFYIYYFIPLNILLLMPKYILYSFKLVKEPLIFSLEKEIDFISTPTIVNITPFDVSLLEDDEDEDGYYPETVRMSIREFIEYYIEGITVHNLEKIEYSLFIYEYLHEKIQKKYNYESTLKIPRYLNEELLYKPIEYKLKGTIYTELIIWMYDLIMIHSAELKPQEHITCMIYLVYFICWLYILILSLPTLNIFDLINMLNNTWLMLGDSFSGEILFI